MDVVEVFAELGNCKDRSIGNLSAFSQDQVSQSWRCFNYPLYCIVTELHTASKVKDSEAFEGEILR